MIKAAIVGAAGYVGGEMCRLLLLHPEVELAYAQSNSHFGKPLHSVHEDLFGDTDMLFCSEISPNVDVVFLCSGHGKSAAFIEANTLSDSCKVIDLGNDFRLTDDSLCAGRTFAYGLVDYFTDVVKECGNVANPGCFATCIQLAVLPLAAQGLLIDDVHISAITGSTGAGQALSGTSHFSWRNNNMSSYKRFTHQHLAEIMQSVVSLQSDYSGELNFIPYRGDFTRGIIATVHTKCPLPIEEVKKMYEEQYATSSFTHVSSTAVNLKQVVNTNKCLLHLEKHGEHLVVTSIIDNLLRGAAGQALENMNILFGFSPMLGLKLKPSAF